MKNRNQNQKHRIITACSVFLSLLVLLTACKLFPYGFYGNKGAVAITIIDQTGSYAALTKVYAKVYNDYSDRDIKDSAYIDYPIGQESVEFTLQGIDPGDWNLNLDFYIDGDNKPYDSLKNMKVRVYEGVTLSYEITLDYNRGQGELVYSIVDTSEGMPADSENKFDFAGLRYFSSGTNNYYACFKIGLDLSEIYTGQITKQIDTLEPPGFMDVSFELQPTADFSQLDYYSLNDSGLVAVTSLPLPGLLNFPQTLRLFSGPMLPENEVFFHVGPATMNANASVYLDYSSFTPGTPLYFQFDSIEDTEYVVVLIINATGQIVAEARMEYPSSGQAVSVVTSYITTVTVAETGRYVVLLYDLEDEREAASGVVNSFMEITSFDDYVTPVEFAYVKIRNVQVISGPVSILP